MPRLNCKTSIKTLNPLSFLLIFYFDDEGYTIAKHARASLNPLKPSIILKGRKPKISILK